MAARELLCELDLASRGFRCGCEGVPDMLSVEAESLGARHTNSPQRTQTVSRPPLYYYYVCRDRSVWPEGEGAKGYRGRGDGNKKERRDEEVAIAG